jgi:hypothetical protein
LLDATADGLAAECEKVSSEKRTLTGGRFLADDSVIDPAHVSRRLFHVLRTPASQLPLSNTQSQRATRPLNHAEQHDASCKRSGRLDDEVCEGVGHSLFRFGWAAGGNKRTPGKADGISSVFILSEATAKQSCCFQAVPAYGELLKERLRLL